MPIRAGIYLRVSKGEHTDNQRPDVERVVATRGLELVATYEEKASAVKARPVFNRMMRDAHRGAFDVLVVWSLGRAATADDASITLSSGLGEIRNGHPDTDLYDPHPALQLSVHARVAPGLAIGGVLGWWPTLDNDNSSLTRVGVETRTYGLRGNVAGVWGAAEIGVGVAKLNPLKCGDCGGPTAAQLAARWGGIVGVGGGLDFFPTSWLTIGVEGRLLGLWFDEQAPLRGPGPAGLTHAIFTGLSVGVRQSSPGASHDVGNSRS